MRLSAKPNAVFLNIPYDRTFRRLYLAYVVGLVQLGLEPRTTLGIPGGKRRLERILELIQSCQYSIHDLSRVQMDRTPPAPPDSICRLSLAVSWASLSHHPHTWFVFETQIRRVQKSLSDLDGSDPNIHNGTVKGVMRELCNAFVRSEALRPTVPEMMRTYRRVSHKVGQSRRVPGLGASSRLVSLTICALQPRRQ